MADLSTDEKATLMALMQRLLEPAPEPDTGIAEAIALDAVEATKRAEVYEQAEAERIAGNQAHELAVIDAQADATVRVIEAEAEAMVDVAQIDAAASVAAAGAIGDGLEVGDEPAASLDAATDLLGELTGDTLDTPAVPVLEVPEVPVLDDVLEDIAPTAQHWFTRPRGKRAR